MEKIDWMDAQELADTILKTENMDSDVEITENALIAKWGIDLEIFQEIVQALFDRMDMGVSMLTNTAHIGFTDGLGWIIKKDFMNQFIAQVVGWLTEGKDISDDIKGFAKVITVNGEPKYEISITKIENNDVVELQTTDS